MFSFTYAETSQFEIELSPSKAWVWEALDITIKAVDIDGNVDKTYDWEILIFSQSDPKAEFPWDLSENTYQFKTSDEWEVKFENAVKFTKVWIQDINVFDVTNEDVYGFSEVEITEGETETQSWEISIDSPLTWTTIWTWSIKVTWKTLKNYRVIIDANSWEKTFETISDSNGAYEVNLTWLPWWENSIVAKVLDADENVIWTSSNVLLKVESTAPSFKSIKVTPENPVEWQENLSVEVSATAWLWEIEIMLNDLLSTLNETNSWIYEWNITAPKENWSYKIDVIMKNELGIESKQNWAYEVVVENIELDAAPVETSTWVNCDDVQKELNITGLKLAKMKTKSVLSWDNLEKATSYNVYKKSKESWEMELVQSVTEPRIEINITWDLVEYDDFTVKAVLKNESCDIESSNYSDMTTVQTWPQEIALFLFALLSSAWIFYYRKRKLS